MEGFLFQAVIYLTAAVIAVPVSVRLGFGSVLGYLIAGLFIGPALGLVTETEDLKHFAEFGVVLMLFLIGLELSPRILWDMRHRLLGLGGLQVVFTTAAIMVGSIYMFGLPWQTALAVGLILALSSTAIVLQTLTEKRLMQTAGGRATFQVLLTQDIAVIPMLAIMPLLAVPGAMSFGPDGSILRGGDEAQGDDGHGAEGAASVLAMIENLPAWGVTLMTVGIVVAVVLFGIYLVRPLFKFVHWAKLRELYVAFALLIVMGIAFAMTMVGLSPALGTFLAGVVLANSEFRHQLESDIAPFKGLLLGLFFITVGAGINIPLLLRDPLEIIGFTLLLMLAKWVILYVLALIFKIRGRARWLFTLGLAQAGEFGFVLLSFSSQLQVLSPSLSARLLLIVALSMLLTPLAFIIYERLTHRMSGDVVEGEPDEIDEQQPIIIAGIGRYGQVVNRLLMLAGFRAVVIDNNMEAVQTLRRFGVKGFFGDPTQPDLLHAAGLDEASALVVALDDKDAALKLVRYAREHRPDIHIIARAHDRVHVYQLHRAGANQIVREMFDSSLRTGRYVLEHLGLTDVEASKIEHFFYRKDREGLRELAELWDPNLPLSQNRAYMERTRELNAELEAALVAHLDEGETPPGPEAADAATAMDDLAEGVKRREMTNPLAEAEGRVVGRPRKSRPGGSRVH